MQNTRLNTLLSTLAQQLNRWATLPWRRLSLIMISLLGGNFLASVVSTTTGQRATLDAPLAVGLTILVELISWLVHSQLIRQRVLVPGVETTAVQIRRPLWLDLLNGVKLGMIYGLFLEAFKLGS